MTNIDHISTAPMHTSPAHQGLRSSLRRNVAVALAAGSGLTLIWALTGGGTFWPVWAWIGLGGALAADAGLRLALRTPPGRTRWIAIGTVACAVLAGVEIAVWAFAGGGYFWPMWALLMLAAALIVRTRTVASA
jgi:hypothetical protein